MSICLPVCRPCWLSGHISWIAGRHWQVKTMMLFSLHPLESLQCAWQSMQISVQMQCLLSKRQPVWLACWLAGFLLSQHERDRLGNQ